MLNTQKLLYILPDVAYLAELLPSKKPSTFTVSSFRQINGEYMDDNEFIAENILKLFKKVDPEEYQLILPDFLFTNTIVNVKEKSDAKIKEHLTKELLPELGIKTDTHQIDTTVLNEHGDTTRVQLSALEKSLLEPLQVSAEQTKVKIKNISPLSWSIKSLVSLEPSISVVQIDSMLYVALHYIGVDQANQATVEEVENIYETIKTLKGAEPSIQTIYLLSNELVEEKLKEHLSDTLPIQQLASKQDEESKMPSYVKKIIESGMRTLSISDYPVPQFELGKAPADAKIEASTKVEEEKPTEPDLTTEESDLPKPQKAIVKEEETEEIKKEKDIEPKKTEKEDKATEEKLTETVDEPKGGVETTAIAPKVIPPAPTGAVEDGDKEDDEIEALLESLKTSDKDEKAVEEKEKLDKSAAAKKTTLAAPKSAPEKGKKVIRNKNQTKTMLKMVFVTLAVFFATVAIGIGIGLGVLQLTQPSATEEPVNPIAEVSPSPSLSPSPSPSPEPEIDTSELSVLVVNATTKAGYAGETADKLTDFDTVKAGNAKGDYDPGLYVLMAEDNPTLVTVLEEATGLTYTFQEKEKVEDPQNQYDAVIVLAE